MFFSKACLNQPFMHLRVSLIVIGETGFTLITMVKSNTLNLLKSKTIYHKGLKAANDIKCAITNVC